MSTNTIDTTITTDGELATISTDNLDAVTGGLNVPEVGIAAAKGAISHGGLGALKGGVEGAAKGALKGLETGDPISMVKDTAIGGVEGAVKHGAFGAIKGGVEAGAKDLFHQLF